MSKNIGVIGCGYWGKNLIRNFYELNSLYAICDTDEKKLKSFRERYHNLSAYNDYNSLLEDPKVRAVVISTPAATHYSLAKDALLADKPIALHYKKGEELVSLAKEKNKIFMVGHVLEYHPVLKNCKIGKNCVIGQNVSIGPNVTIGNNVKIQNLK